MTDALVDPVRLGSMLFTIVEPHRGHEVAYNRWYERDHFYSGCMVGPWTLAGRRFVATRDCKARRSPAGGGGPIVPDADGGSYLALYWIQHGRHAEWMRWAKDQVNWLHANGRMFADRDHVHTNMYGYRWGAFRDDDGVPPELALDHPFGGLVVVIGDMADGVDGAAFDDWSRQHLASTLGAGAASGSSAMCLVSQPLGLGRGGPADVPQLQGSERRFLHLWFIEGDPVAAWDGGLDAATAAIDASGLATVAFASPFLATIPGTDTYTDQLW